MKTKGRVLATATAFFLALTVFGCASAGSGGTRIRQNVITPEELQASTVSDLYDLVQELRPRWLTTRGQQSFSAEPEIVVYQGQVLLGGLEMLRQLTPDMVHSLRYLDGPTASASLPGLGSRHVQGAIVIESKR